MKQIISVFSILTFLVIGLSTSSIAQEQQKINIRETYDYQKNVQIYSRAMKYNDVEAAKSALYNLIAMEPANDSLLFDLAYLYFDNQKYISSILATNDLLTLNPDHLAALEISAISYENIGAREKALEAYESLYLKNDNINTLYKIAFLQYELNRFSEAKTTAEIIMDNEKSEEATLFFGTTENTQQEVPMRASIYNLLGLINKEQGNKEEAKDNFNKALEIAPEFQLAQNNLNELQNNN